MSLKKNVIANYIGNGWTAIMHLVFIPFYIKYLGMEAYGLIGFYAMLQTCLSLLDMGLTPTLGREMARFTGEAHTSNSIRTLLRSIEVLVFSIALIYMLFVWGGSGWLASEWLNADKLPLTVVTQACAIMGLVTGLRFIEGIYRGAILGLQQQVIFSAANSIMATLRGGGAVLVLAYYKPTIDAYFFWQALISLLTVITFISILYYYLPKATEPIRFSINELKKVWRFAAGIMATTFLALILTQVDKVVLSRLLPLEEFGNYSLVATITNVLMILVAPITQAYYPKLAELKTRDSQETLTFTFHKGAQLATVITAAAFCVLFLFGNRVVALWTGKPELALKIFTLLRIMALGTFLNSLMHMPYMLQLSYGWSSFSAKVNLIAVVVLVPSILIVAPVYGPIGAASVWVVLNAGYVFISTYFMFRKILVGENLRWLKNDVLLPCSFAFCVALIFVAIKPNIANRFLEFAYIALAGGISLAMAAIGAKELRASIKNMLPFARAKAGEID
jgi:O-antigen/teichoic acid export membrane protein